jgi:hypothetical protein
MCKLQDLRSHNVPGGLLPDGVWLVTHGYEWLRGVLGTSNDAQPPPSPSLSVPHPRDKRAPPCLVVGWRRRCGGRSGEPGWVQRARGSGSGARGARHRQHTSGSIANIFLTQSQTHPRDKRAPPYLSTLAPLSRCTVAIEAQLRT